MADSKQRVVQTGRADDATSSAGDVHLGPKVMSRSARSSHTVLKNPSRRPSGSGSAWVPPASGEAESIGAECSAAPLRQAWKYHLSKGSNPTGGQRVPQGDVLSFRDEHDSDHGMPLSAWRELSRGSPGTSSSARMPIPPRLPTRSPSAPSLMPRAPPIASRTTGTELDDSDIDTFTKLPLMPPSAGRPLMPRIADDARYERRRRRRKGELAYTGWMSSTGHLEYMMWQGAVCSSAAALDLAAEERWGVVAEEATSPAADSSVEHFDFTHTSASLARAATDGPWGSMQQQSSLLVSLPRTSHVNQGCRPRAPLPPPTCLPAAHGDEEAVGAGLAHCEAVGSGGSSSGSGDEAIPEEGQHAAAPQTSPPRNLWATVAPTSPCLPMVLADTPVDDPEEFEVEDRMPEAMSSSKRGLWIDWDCEEESARRGGGLDSFSPSSSYNSSSPTKSLLDSQVPSHARSISEEHLLAARTLLFQTIDPFSDEPCTASNANSVSPVSCTDYKSSSVRPITVR